MSGLVQHLISEKGVSGVSNSNHSSIADRCIVRFNHLAMHIAKSCCSCNTPNHHAAYHQQCWVLTVQVTKLEAHRQALLSHMHSAEDCCAQLVEGLKTLKNKWCAMCVENVKLYKNIFELRKALNPGKLCLVPAVKRCCCSVLAQIVAVVTLVFLVLADYMQGKSGLSMSKIFGVSHHHGRLVAVLCSCGGQACRELLQEWL